MAHAPTTTVNELTRSVTGRLRMLRTKIFGWFLADGLAKLFVWLVALCAADLLIDWLFELDRPQRIVMLVLVVAALGYVVYRYLIRPLQYHLSDDALCLSVEQQHRELREGFISALQFSRMSDFEAHGVSPTLVGATISHGMQAADSVDFTRVLRGGRFASNLALLGAMVLVLAGVGVAAANNIDPFATWFNRNVMLGDRQWPQDTYLIVHGAQDDRLVVPRGDDWPLVVEVSEDSVEFPDEVSLDIRTPAGRRIEPLEQQEDERFFQTVLPAVVEEFRFRAYAGRSYTPWIEVGLVDRPAVKELELAATTPKYAGSRVEELPPGKGPYYVLKGSELSVKGTANKPLSKAVLVVGPVRREMTLTGETGFETVLPPDELSDGVCQIELTDTEQLILPGSSQPGPLTSKRPTRFTVKIRPDREPVIQARLAGISTMVVPQARIPILARATDDFLVTALRLSHQWKTQEGTEAEAEGVIQLDEIEDYKALLNQQSLEFDYLFELEPLAIPAGSALIFQIEADDNDDVSGPKTGMSTPFRLRVVGEDVLREDLLRREKEQRQEFERLLKQQEDLLTETRASLARVREMDELSPDDRQLFVRMHKLQKLIGTNVGGVANRMEAIIVEIINNQLEEIDGPLQTRLQSRIIDPMLVDDDGLANALMPASADQLDTARRQGDQAQERNEALSAAVETQEQIAAKMREILLHMVKAEGYQEAVNLLYDIQRRQRELFEQTEKERKERLDKTLNPPGNPAKDPDEGNDPPPEESND